jgi:hypothetical protein
LLKKLPSAGIKQDIEEELE